MCTQQFIAIGGVEMGGDFVFEATFIYDQPESINSRLWTLM